MHGVENTKMPYNKTDQDYSNNKSSDYQVGGSHYKNMTIQPWQIFDTWSIEQQIGFHRGNAIKYLMRLGSKDDPLQEAKKALQYCQKLIEVLERQK